MNNFTHWQLKQDDRDIIWLSLNKANVAANTLNREVLEEFERIVDDIQQKENLAGLIIQSAKSSGFILGADIQAFTEIKDANEAFELVRKGQIIFEKLENLKIPTLALIDGACLGGGLELALACDYRVAHDNRKTKLGLPEVLLGIHPGWGGTIRLPRCIGALKAMDLILSGRTVPAKVAAKIGFIDAAVPMRHLKTAAIRFILNQPERHKAPWYDKAFSISFIRQAVGSLLRKKVMVKAKPEHYPAPYAVIDNWVKVGIDNEKAYITEANSIGKLLVSDTSRNLVRVFFLQEQLKSLAKHSDFKAQHVHVIGAGTMGGDIAAWCALRGMQVTLQDRSSEQVAPAIARAYQLFSKKIRDKRLIQAAMDRLIPDLEGEGVSKADVIIEAIYENLEAKQNLFKTLEASAKPSAILASNTSSIPLDEINQTLNNPERLVGIHYFNPVAKMPLVEVVKGQLTSQDVLNDAIAFVRSIDKLPLPVKSSPGFLVNRILMPYLMECVALVDEGYSITAIDSAAKKFGMPMGPVEIADTVGLDVCLSVAKNMIAHFGGTVPTRLESMVSQSKLGKKSGQGFYTYKDGKQIKEPAADKGEHDELITHRLIMRLVNESFAVLRENVVESADLLDAGMIFGAGFAPFLGGPIHYARALGKDELTKIFNDLQSDCGKRFEPDTALSEIII
ncbi:MAG: crotonase [Legionellales bacterium]|nr:crotonase [Legionellales bacterium]|tara:strand:+ start:154 stop:2187 length:2034 start_codon:yes stop_codon:yes gene_type:complete